MKKIKKVKKKKKKYYIGLDMSNTCSGLTILDSEGEYVETVTFKFKKAKKGKKEKGWYYKYFLNKDRARHFTGYEMYLANIRDKIHYIRNKLKGEVECVAIEGYAYGIRRSRSLTGLGELGGIIRRNILNLGIKIIEVMPTQIKKFATGKGRCPKDVVYHFVCKKWGIEFDSIALADRGDAAESFVAAKVAYCFGEDITDFKYKYEKEVLKVIRKERSDGG